MAGGSASRGVIDNQCYLMFRFSPRFKKTRRRLHVLYVFRQMPPMKGRRAPMASLPTSISVPWSTVWRAVDPVLLPADTR